MKIGFGAFAAEVGAWNRERGRPMRGESRSQQGLGAFFIPPCVQPRRMGRLRPLQVDVSFYFSNTQINCHSDCTYFIIFTIKIPRLHRPNELKIMSRLLRLLSFDKNNLFSHQDSKIVIYSFSRN